MNPMEELKRAHASVLAEENRLFAEYSKVKAVRVALEAGMKAEAASPLTAEKAAAGGLRAAILGVLGRKPMGNGAIRLALKESGYGFSLNPLHVSKTLTMLHKARKVKRVGAGVASTYTLP